MIVYFLRHASAGEHFTSPKKDEKRALDKEGIEQCGYIGRALAALEVQVDVIVSSPLKRCTQTDRPKGWINLPKLRWPLSEGRSGNRSADVNFRSC